MDWERLYPHVGFHFKVEVTGFSDQVDIGFQEVTGLSVKMETEDVNEGGENRFVHKLPTRMTYSELSLKRGMISASSSLTDWVRKSITQFEDIEPKDILISLLDEEHQPLATWNIIRAIPTNWQISDLKAEDNAIMVESINLVYTYFEYNPNP
ncbi:MAG TPA: glycerol acyltransferase [Cytophagales bacterium]|nr:glycerol acyltransferase [Cytophagales bacterium]HAA22773.1 glycerol acyltransferase [Cytophagales bacterium]HAP59799.1 glycerol acyltransferase [Cytophagales bacterium]